MTNGKVNLLQSFQAGISLETACAQGIEKGSLFVGFNTQTGQYGELLGCKVALAASNLHGQQVRVVPPNSIVRDR